ncbi:uncharacterized protein LOC6614584 [Drosophila sechellia]|uniref:GM17290 n=1 Tax=Drosophila sechellia TaxID=7238 RepID=B4I5K2_DROSE|nr:uncharacterized protein LOC6614584 [Drosophila sechellia]EDW55658.1 GM17290 [Drosophila sechellia]
MYVISTSKKTVLSDFADLETKSEYVHQNAEPTDFQFNGQRRVFVEVDKMAGLAVMRIKEKDGKTPEIQRVRKLTIDNAFCVACAKQSLEEIAVGQSGCVKLYNFRTAQLIHRFPADPQRSTVLYMDYNNTDEYIAAVRDGGDISILGTKTKQKTNTFTIDGDSTLVRFHPSKRFHLSIASYKGAVTVYDVQGMRKIFHASEAHSAPCRDISMCASQPAVLVSVGYDCKINIFDIRRNRAQASTDRLTYSHPLSTVSLSECGTYLCAGNLKGELIAYDMRSTKAPLTVRSVHDAAVTRVAFVPVPSVDSQQNGSLNSSENATGLTAEAPRVERGPSDELRKSIAANLLSTQNHHLTSLGYGVSTPTIVRRDSFCEFLDAQGPRAVDRMSTRLGASYRDSFDWETLNRKPQPNETANRQSLCPPVASGPTSVDNSVNSSTTESLQQTLSGPLKDRSNISGDGKLMKIAETDELCEEQSANISVASSTGGGSDKENPPPVDAEMKRRLRLLSASRNSTPHHTNITPQSSNPLLKPQQLLAKSSSGLSAQMDADWRKEFSELRDFVDQRCGKVERELEYVTFSNQRLLANKMTKYMDKQAENTREIRDALALLLQGDSFMREFSRLKNENEMLKAKLKFYLEQEQTESCGE